MKTDTELKFRNINLLALLLQLRKDQKYSELPELKQTTL